MIDLINNISFTEVMIALIGVGVADHLAVSFLPDHIAGPGGWLIDTTSRDDAAA